MNFSLNSAYQPTGDQPQAIKKLVTGVKKGLHDQVLLGVTGSGKTYTMANVIQQTNSPTLIITHNKTLAGQLYQEMREFFPTNAVSYFVSYYDFYQPEAYIPSSDTYIEKEAQINSQIDKLRLAATTNLMTREDVIVVASVSCIYNIGSPEEYNRSMLTIKVGEQTAWKPLASRLIDLQYSRSEYEFGRGTFRIRGTSLDIYPAYEDTAYRLDFSFDKVAGITPFDPVSGSPIQNPPHKILDKVTIYPAKHYLIDPNAFEQSESQIRLDLKKEHQALIDKGKLLEAQRLLQRTNYDLEIIKELGYVNGIENYSRYFDGRKIGERPYTLLDYFNYRYLDNWLCLIDESHMTIPQLRGMYNGDHARKQVLIDNGFRLRAALDNRPLKFTEFYGIPQKFIYLSATPDDWELSRAEAVVEQLVRPTGIVDPPIEVRPISNQVQDVTKEIVKRAKLGERCLITTLTKKTAEDLASYLKDKNIRAEYLHSDIETLERSDILDNLRKNKFDCLIGVNLLREGLDLPEVSLVAILDADKEGFLRSRVSLIQTMGRAARNIKGYVILYADRITNSMSDSIQEIKRRRQYQLDYNRTHSISPKSITKPLRDRIIEKEDQDEASQFISQERTPKQLAKIDVRGLTAYDKSKLIKKLEKDMHSYASDLQFEMAIMVRDKIRELKSTT